MTGVFTCPHCGAQTEIVDKSYLGQKGPCFCCERMVSVPRSFRLLADRRQPQFPKRMLLRILVAAAAGFVIVLLLTIGMGLRSGALLVTADSRMKAACLDNLAQIAIAMDSYHDQHSCYPPAYLAGDDGRPMHSWRVLLLPHLGFDWLYEDYRFNEPWNSDHNLEIIGEMPTCYACPFDPVALQEGETNYMVVVGKETMFPGETTTNKRQLTDGLAGTLMVVEVPGTQIAWTEPRDLRSSDMQFSVNAPSGEAIGSFHEAGAMCVTADGKTHYLPDSTTSVQLQALLSIQGKETIDPDFAKSK